MSTPLLRLAFASALLVGTSWWALAEPAGSADAATLAFATHDPSAPDPDLQAICPPTGANATVEGEVGASVIMTLVDQTAGLCPSGTCSATYLVTITNNQGALTIVDTGSERRFIPPGGDTTLTVVLTSECETCCTGPVWTLQSRDGLTAVFGTITFDLTCGPCPNA